MSLRTSSGDRRRLEDLLRAQGTGLLRGELLLSLLGPGSDLSGERLVERGESDRAL
jgi:hypothetical protein